MEPLVRGANELEYLGADHFGDAKAADKDGEPSKGQGGEELGGDGVSVRGPLDEVARMAPSKAADQSEGYKEDSTSTQNGLGSAKASLEHELEPAMHETGNVEQVSPEDDCSDDIVSNAEDGEGGPAAEPEVDDADIDCCDEDDDAVDIAE